jgi:hypothetical protein
MRSISDLGSKGKGYDASSTLPAQQTAHCTFGKQDREPAELVLLVGTDGTSIVVFVVACCAAARLGLACHTIFGPQRNFDRTERHEIEKPCLNQM